MSNKSRKDLLRLNQDDKHSNAKEKRNQEKREEKKTQINGRKNCKIRSTAQCLPGLIYYLYSTISRRQLRSPSASTSRICCTDSVRLCVGSLVSSEDPEKLCVATGELVDVGESAVCICSRAFAATVPLLGKLLFCESGLRISHADEPGGDVEAVGGFGLAFSIAES